VLITVGLTTTEQAPPPAAGGDDHSFDAGLQATGSRAGAGRFIEEQQGVLARRTWLDRRSGARAKSSPVSALPRLSSPG